MTEEVNDIKKVQDINFEEVIYSKEEIRNLMMGGSEWSVERFLSDPRSIENHKVTNINFQFGMYSYKNIGMSGLTFRDAILKADEVVGYIREVREKTEKLWDSLLAKEYHGEEKKSDE